MGVQGQEASAYPTRSLSQARRLSRRDLIRWSIFASLTPALGPAFSLAQAISSDLSPAARGEDGSKFLADPNWKAVFFNDHQNQSLIALSDVIIPATDTPGAKEALVNRYLDLVLSVQPATFQRQFAEALEFIDRESRQQFGEDFLALTPDDRISLLTPWAYSQRPAWWIEQGEESQSAQQHFRRLKGLIVGAYYGSEIGQKELGWDGAFTHGPYQGCEHAPTDHT